MYKTTMYKTTGHVSLALAAALVLGACAATATDPAQDTVQSKVEEAVDTGGTVAVSVIDGVATLSGFVYDARAKDNAEAAATEVSGVTDVVNHIMVEGDTDPTS